ncbi:MAG: metallophosphoesterase [Candidatus Kapaibacterium sp.]
MKLYVLSDLHIEFEKPLPYREERGVETFKLCAEEADVVVLAGDIHVKDKGVEWAVNVFSQKPVLYVLGNHEYYGTAYPKLLDQLKEKTEGTNVRIMENDSFTYMGVRFFCSTLWTNFELFGSAHIAMGEANQKMSDYQRIRLTPSYRKLRAVDTAAIHRTSIAWLMSEVQDAYNGKKVVVTHHAPSMRSVPDHFQNDLLTSAYASELKSFIEESDIALWIHGHVHKANDYYIGSTRVLSNPKGYPDEEGTGFRPNLIIEV